MSPLIRIVGCGRWLMQDDQAGLLVAQRLLEQHIPYAVVETTETPATAFAETEMAADSLLIIVDAARAGARHPPGTTKKVEYRSRVRESPAELFVDTHSPSLLSGLLLGDALGNLPRRVWLYVIFGEHFERGHALSPEVRGSIEKLLKEIEADVGAESREFNARTVDRQFTS